LPLAIRGWWIDAPDAGDCARIPAFVLGIARRGRRLIARPPPAAERSGGVAGDAIVRIIARLGDLVAGWAGSCSA
jgi:hypothetical protein